MAKKHISVVTPCFNEEENVRELYEVVKGIFAKLPQYTYEHLYIDNCSKDATQTLLREIAARDKNVKAIFNTRNFGHIRSPYHGLLQSRGDASIWMASDFQEPPDLIPQFLEQWEAGYKLVLGVKETSSEPVLMFTLRKIYYTFVNRIAGEVELIKNATGFGLYDRKVLDTLRQINDPYPYTRGLIADLGYDSAKVVYHQERRRRGITKNNFYTLYDMAMLGITNHSKVPLRLATMLGFAMSFISFIAAIVYLVVKLLFWYRFAAGMAPILIGLLFFSSVQLFFIGLLGEYIGSIHTQVRKLPLVVEKERINFDVEEREPEPLEAASYPYRPQEERTAVSVGPGRRTGVDF